MYTLLMKLLASLKDVIGDDAVIAKNASADSFYSSQGRIDPSFADENGDVVDKMIEAGICTIEMESTMLIHLASCAPDVGKGRIYAAAVSTLNLGILP
jgi:uridine phosphorylase